MRIWAILMMGTLGAFFVCRQERVRRLLSPERNNQVNREELKRSLDKLTAFLSIQNQFKWVGILRNIRNELQNHSTEEKALSQLCELMGGRGSLNAIAFKDSELNKELGHLLDTVFDDVEFYHASPDARIEWAKAERDRSEETPPRLRHHCLPLHRSSDILKRGRVDNDT